MAASIRRLPEEELDRLFEAVCGLDPIAGDDERAAARALYALLGAGRPVGAAQCWCAWDTLFLSASGVVF